MTTFTDLQLAEPLLRALAAEGYETPTPIQAKAIPHVMSGVDLLGIAQTGTGKTAAFALPILHRLISDKKPPMRKGCRVLVLSPTRELATQIADSFRSYGRFLNLTVAVIFGGVGHRPQIQAMAKGVDILVATPGRLLDHIGERAVDLKGTEIFVLDEADQMLDLGFVKPIRRIVSEFSGRRQNLFFSATMPPEIGSLADDLLREPVKVAVTPAAKTVDLIAQRVIHVDQPKKRALLAELLNDPSLTRALVFTRTKRGADKVAQYLEGLKIQASAIHGNKSQRQREHALEDFKTARVRVLVATDIAARGIDIDQVSHVINFEMPEVPEAYVHRIGRTARAGASGIAISLCDSEERGLLRDIERLIKQSIPSEDRRADTSLSVDPKAGSGRPMRGREGGGGGRDGGRGGRSDARPVGRHAGPPTGGRGRPPARAGERSGDRSSDRDRSGDRDRDRDEVWSNHGGAPRGGNRPEPRVGGAPAQRPAQAARPGHSGARDAGARDRDAGAGRADRRGRRAF